MKISRTATTLLALGRVVSGFSPLAPGRYGASSTRIRPTNKITPSTPLYAGFGGGAAAGSKKNKKKKTPTDTKLKPKQQWDRYVDLKDEPAVAVAVQPEGTEEWLGVGSVRSRDSQYTPQAVFRQRALLAEHARRLHPGQVTSDGTLSWGYREPDGAYVRVDRACLDAAETEGLEKWVGFEGLPVAGFYTDSATGRIDASALGQNKKKGGGGPISGSGKKGPGDGVI
mmetsp:Transcript_8811/g.18082  ORF Transcript_8811/g.18082 Transcript_8811/m.18082 type:complete len:227 (+) Transcript_8811:71-751(+)|eukprot:CAMPEP_0194324168 /NCGR_PEP_ID=MMETSP0171-20130528/26748_1 /TAXON_ID=218684 /ORGANISM="Corethron pennatum, Strain L29A3" /LENGTH=226 /DNA_ID=CAMNT_0039083001 /DNA_START=31 /DNA_END=711 /DNA_ORIENTATION=-